MSPRRGVNAGPDKGLPWPLGEIAGWAQERRAFKSAIPPRKFVRGNVSEGYYREVSYSQPGDKPWYGWAKRRPDGLWDTFRTGYRWDPNWGDEHVRGHNPDPEIIGGYFPDTIIKRKQARPHITYDGAEPLPGVVADGPWWARQVARLVGAR